MAVLQHELTLSEAADLLSHALPGHRVEILQGRLTVTPPPDGSHALSLSWLVVAFDRAGARKAGLRYVQGVGLWLPTLPDDYAIPDFSLVDEDFRDALVQKNCYAPNVFRLVAEVTSSNWSDDLGPKVECYAEASTSRSTSWPTASTTRCSSTGIRSTASIRPPSATGGGRVSRSRSPSASPRTLRGHAPRR